MAGRSLVAVRVVNCNTVFESAGSNIHSKAHLVLLRLKLQEYDIVLLYHFNIQILLILVSNLKFLKI
jgi:hypothetical protein